MHFKISIEVVDDQFLINKQYQNQINNQNKPLPLKEVKQLNKNKQENYTSQGNYCQEIY
jgi:hypothetical protein